MQVNYTVLSSASIEIYSSTVAGTVKAWGGRETDVSQTASGPRKAIQCAKQPGFESALH